MAEDIKKLYKVEGGSGEQRERVEVAVGLLCSQQCDGIGEELLRGAYDLHKKPIIIAVTNHHDNIYHTLHDEHTIDVTPEDLQENLLACRLARQLKHAGQPTFKEETQKILGLQDQYYKNKTRGDSYKLTKDNIDGYIDDILLPMILQIRKDLSLNSTYIRYIEKIEKPAIEIEKKTALLLGEIGVDSTITNTSRAEIKAGLLVMLEMAEDKKWRNKAAKGSETKGLGK